MSEELEKLRKAADEASAKAGDLDLSREERDRWYQEAKRLREEITRIHES